MTLPKPTSSFKEINNLIHKSFLPKIIVTAMEVGLFDTLHNGSMSPADAADQLELLPEATAALMDVLDAAGYLAKRDNSYALTQVSRDFLVAVSPFFQGTHLANATMDKVLDRGATVLRDGAPDFDPSIFCNQKVMKQFGQVAKAGSLQDVVVFAQSLPEFVQMRWMCDIGGNYGYLSMGLLDANPRLKARVYDLPKVAELAKDLVRSAGYSARLTPVGFDLIAGDGFGEGYDLVLASHCLHMLDGGKRLRQFFKSARHALNPGGVFISNHMTMDSTGDDYLTQCIKEYHSRLMGVATHHLHEDALMAALEQAGFGDFKIRPGKEASYFNTMLLAARKM